MNTENVQNIAKVLSLSKPFAYLYTRLIFIIIETFSFYNVVFCLSCILTFMSWSDIQMHLLIYDVLHQRNTWEMTLKWFSWHVHSRCRSLIVFVMQTLLLADFWISKCLVSNFTILTALVVIGWQLLNHLSVTGNLLSFFPMFPEGKRNVKHQQVPTLRIGCHCSITCANCSLCDQTWHNMFVVQWSVRLCIVLVIC